MAPPKALILLDGSHLWGLLAWHALVSMGTPCRLVKARDIAAGCLQGREAVASLLLVPGGSARKKALALGEAGREQIRLWLRAGGNYLGICGGAGLALTLKRPDWGLGICPWSREPFQQRLHHLISGSIIASRENWGEIPLPVWWPGRFSAQQNSRVQVLASYQRPGHDLWLADSPFFSELNSGATSSIRAAYKFPAGQPLVIAGKHGAGRYVLSYAHLETPEWPEANAWLGELVQELTGAAPLCSGVSSWMPPDELLKNHVQIQLFDNDLSISASNILLVLHNLTQAAEQASLFFARASWLWGWRQGMPGMSINNLLAAATLLAQIRPSGPCQLLWRKQGRDFCRKMRLFINASNKLFRQAPQGMDRQSYEQLFGHPMLGGSLAEELALFMEELLYLADNFRDQD